MFSAVSLSGAATHASVHRAVDRPDLVAGAARALADDGFAETVLRVVLHTRDIDGTTVVVELESPATDWASFGAAADALVSWVDRVLPPRLRAERARVSGSPSTSSSARALWAHTVLTCDHERPPGAGPHCDESTASNVLPTAFTTVVLGTDRAYLGWHASLLCVADPDNQATLVSLLDELHAWWSASWLLDQRLLAIVIATSDSFVTDPLGELASVPDMLAAVTSQVGTVRARLDTFRLSLGGTEWPVWDAACQRWEMEDNMVAIARKRELLMDMHSAFRDAIQARRSARLNQLAGFFAAMSSLASFVAVSVFLYPDFDQDGGHVLMRLALTGVAVVLTAFALFWSSRVVMTASRTVAANRAGRRQLLGPTEPD